MRARLHPQPSSIAQEGHELSQGSQIRYRPGSYHTQGSPEINLSQKTTLIRQNSDEKKKRATQQVPPGTKNRRKEPGSDGPSPLSRRKVTGAGQTRPHATMWGHSITESWLCTRVTRIQ
ncbi:hypothetical protein AVEN_245433-1 [Araneus ventricosus]|uniref:Uncharacterized protein n=1 Tax=Araneus ventricosus TaxID=182803 RepID=A0A4Y1ZXB3_ARAVE|nr:hypothetical protein AVEN_245433-1 [Araneus ventricosus]